MEQQQQQQQDQSETVQQVTDIIAFYITTVLSTFGIIGNVLSALVLQRSNRQRRCQLFTLLCVLCLVDAVFILTNFMVNVLTVLYEHYQVGMWAVYYFYLKRGYAVKYVAPICFVTQLASIYITLLVSVERWTAVCRPLALATASDTGWSMRRNVLAVLAFSIVYNVPKFFEVAVLQHPIGSDVQPASKRRQLMATSLAQFGCYHAHSNGSDCEIFKFSHSLASWTSQPADSTSPNLYKILYTGVLYSLFYFLLPVAGITYMNIRIAISLRRSMQEWRSADRRQEKEAQLTYVSLAIVVSFYLFMLPNVLLTILDVLAGQSLMERFPQQMQLAVVTTNFLVLINSCLNFILYCMIGKKFRESLRDLVCCSNGRSQSANRATAGCCPCIRSAPAANHSSLPLQPLSHASHSRDKV